MKVVIAIDGSKFSKEALQWYLKNVHKTDNKVILVNVTDHLHNFAYNTSIIPGDPELIQLAYQEEEHNAKAIMDEMNDFISKNHVDGEVVRVFGHPGQQIVKKAHDVEADLVLTGSRGLGTIRRTILGSVSDYVIHHSNVPVIVCQHQ